MEIKCNITRKDYWNFTKYAFIHVPISRAFLILVAIILFFIFASSINYYYKQGVSQVITYIISMLIFLVVSYNMFKLFAMWLPTSKPGILGEHIISISPEGIRERTLINDGIIIWAGIKKISTNKKYIYIFIDNMMGHIIPKESFSTKEEADEFLNTALMLWDKYK